jgi:hypothetical protein
MRVLGSSPALSQKRRRDKDRAPGPSAGEDAGASIGAVFWVLLIRPVTEGASP